MRIYKSGDQLWQTHNILAKDDTTAQHLAQQEFDKLVAQLAEQQCPKIDNPTLERFGLYHDDRLVCEVVFRH
jgi:hypothetical protein